MKYGKLIVEESEFKLINDLISHVSPSENLFNSCIQRLKSELTNAEIRQEGQMPMDVVRLNSLMDVETPMGDIRLQLVLPERTNSLAKRISLLTPMGSALFGYAQGDEVIWNFPEGEKKILIKRILP